MAEGPGNAPATNEDKTYELIEEVLADFPVDPFVASVEADDSKKPKAEAKELPENVDERIALEDPGRDDDVAAEARREYSECSQTAALEVDVDLSRPPEPHDHADEAEIQSLDVSAQTAAVGDLRHRPGAYRIPGDASFPVEDDHAVEGSAVSAEQIVSATLVPADDDGEVVVATPLDDEDKKVKWIVLFRDWRFRSFLLFILLLVIGLVLGLVLKREPRVTVIDAATMRPTVSPAPTQHPTAVPTNTVAPTPTPCITSTSFILEAELSIEDTEQSRTYEICPNTTIRLGSVNKETGLYEGEPYLAFFNPNVIVKCGPEGDLVDLCIIEGGSTQAIIAHASHFDNPAISNRSDIDLRNIGLEGLVFSGSSANVNVHVAAPAWATFKDCAFVDNDNEGNVRIWPQSKLTSAPNRTVTRTSNDEIDPGEVTFVDCVLSENVARPGEHGYPTALIENHLSTVVVKDCRFKSNSLPGRIREGEFTALIANFYGSLSVEGSCFTFSGVSSAPIMIVPGRIISLFNNFGHANFVVDEERSCDAIGIILSGPSFLSLKDCVPFDAKFCPLEGGQMDSPAVKPDIGVDLMVLAALVGFKTVGQLS